MRINEIITEAVEQRLDSQCWASKHKAGTKIKGGVRVNNCVPNESVDEASGGTSVKGWAAQVRTEHGIDTKFINDKHSGGTVNRAIARNAQGETVGVYNRNTGSATVFEPKQQVEETAAWKRKEGKNKKGGLNQKGVDSYRKEHPGSKLQTAVTKKPSELKAGSKDANRRKSFCARMSGMQGPMKKPNGDPTRKALALRKWHCESVEHFVEMFCENMNHCKDNQAVPELKAALIARKTKLQAASEDQVYDIIDSIMTRIAKSHGISGQKLHDMWVKEYDQIPDTWIMK